MTRSAPASRAIATAVLLLPMVAGSCRRVPGAGATPLPAPSIAADSTRASTVAPGVVLHSWWMAEGPWVVHALDVDRARCWAPAPLDPQPDGPARELLTTMLASEHARLATSPAAGAVNADFFLFAPNGLPTGAVVRDGRVLFGPGDREVLAADAQGRLHVTRLAADGWIVAGRDSVRITRWNRPDARAVALFDARYGERVDSAAAGLALPLRHVAGSAGSATAGDVARATMIADEATRIDGADTSALAIPASGALIVAGRGTSDSVRATLTRIGRAGGGETVRVRVAITPFHPRHAVGGNGVLLRGGQVPARLDSVGQASFRARHPRTAVGFDATGRRLLLVTVDGRQPGYSAGMTLQELAALMRRLGAVEALNLDGGGSTALVVPDLRSGTGVRIVNRPSDKTERKVANGLAVVRECKR